MAERDPIYVVREVRDKGEMVVEWEDGERVIYPIPTKPDGAPLTGADLDDWAARRYTIDKEKRAELRARLAPLRAMKDEVRNARLRPRPKTFTR